MKKILIPPFKNESRSMAEATSRKTTTLVLTSVRGRIDYNFQNYCATCGYKLPKEIVHCPDCKQKVRTRLWHRPKTIDMKRV